MLHDLGAVVVEDGQVLVGLDEIDAPASEKPGDVETGLANLHDAVPGDGGATDPVPADGPLLVSRAGWVGFRRIVATRSDPTIRNRGRDAGATALIHSLVRVPRAWWSVTKLSSSLPAPALRESSS